MDHKKKCKLCNKTFLAEKIVERNGKKFKQHQPQALYCSDKCVTLVRKESAKKSWWNGVRNKYLKKKTKSNCVICGRIYYTFIPSHQKTCLKKECRKERHKRCNRVNKGQEEIVVDKLHKIKCQYKECGKVFTYMKSSSSAGGLPSHCSPKCSKAKYAKSTKGRNKIARRSKVRRQTDIEYQLQGRIRHRVREALKNEVRGRVRRKRGRPIEDIISCSLKDLKRHIEKRFTKGMSWKVFMSGNGYIHLDHIKPIASFDLTKESEQKKCFHYTNLQPLWAKDNLSKGAKIAA